MGERYLHLRQAHLKVRQQDGRIQIATDAFARQVELRVDGTAEAIFEDNHFDLPPGGRRVVAIARTAGVRKLDVRALNADPVSIVYKP
jgi:hypothetical protein